jgi:hypothetical protein
MTWILLYVLGIFLFPLCLRLLTPSYFKCWFEDDLGKAGLIGIMFIWPVSFLFLLVRGYLEFLNKHGKNDNY